MRIKDGFILREIAGSYVIVAVGDASKYFKGMIKLNYSGSILWKELEKGVFEVDKLVETLKNIYDVDDSTAKQDVIMFLNVMKENNIVE